MRRLVPYWGYAVLAVAIFGLVRGFALGVGLVLSVAAFSYFIFWVPVWCGALNRNGQFCRNNSAGIMLGCRLREHKFQKIKATFYRGRWKALNSGLWVSPSAVLATVGSLIAIVTVLATLLAALVRG